MNWPATAIFWHAYPIRFVGGEDEAVDRVEHRLWRVVNWLDYVVDVGLNGLLLAPMFASKTHGYDTLDHFRVDPRLGDDADVDDLLLQAHRRGIRVVFDGVFNHVSRDHEIVQRALSAGPETPEGAWIKWSDGYPYCFEGSLDLVELNLANPEVQDYIARIMIFWLDRGIDGWRLDAAYAAGADAWAPIVARVRDSHPDAWLLGEVLHGDYTAFVATSGVDTVTQYELWKAIWSSLNDQNMFELEWSLKRHAEFCEHFLPQTFVGNHDVTRIATQITDERNVPLAVALLMFLPGTPSVYAGDEQGFTGEKLHAPRGDDAVRPPFPEDPSGLLPFGQHMLEVYREVIRLRRVHPWMAEAVATPTHVQGGAIAIQLDAGDAGRLTLAVNASDESLVLPGTHHDLDVGPHSWALG
ncbi:alpha-amylase family glycosyl hydrolase [Nigerium sp.]|jgi:glycosidase|uniref:alpha-amylase family glycosyl hydrolase n=1 Tax=Nigerium sp. TaxID=2042655 RepID=UPI003221F0AA